MRGGYEPREVDILWSLERRHLEEAEFAFEARDDALDAPHYTLEELGRGIEARLLAHVDALAAGGSVVEERLLVPALRDADAYPERVGAAVLACSDPREAVDALLEADAEELAQGLVRGLALRDDQGLDALLVQTLRSASGPRVASVLELLARRGVTVDPWVSRFAEHDDVRVCRAAAKLLRHCPDTAALAALAPLAQGDDPHVRDAALETALLRGVAGAWESMAYWAFTARSSPGRRRALVWVALLGDAAAHARVLELVDDEAHRADALWALGFSGSLEAVRRCLSFLGDAELGPLAAEVVCTIAGLPTDGDGFWRDPTPSETDEGDAPPLFDDLQVDLSLAPEAFLPIPEPESIVAWWRGVEGRFEPGLRYLGGRPLDADVIFDALRSGPLRRRHDLALELGARSGGTIQLPTRALTRVQFHQLGLLPQQPAWGRLEFQQGRAIPS